MNRITLAVCSTLLLVAIAHAQNVSRVERDSILLTTSAESSHWQFCETEIDDKGHIIAPKGWNPTHYLEDKEMSAEARKQLALLRPGVSRGSVAKTWTNTGGGLQCQYLLLEKGGGPEYVAVRIEWRPKTMLEAIFNDRTLREQWILKHTPKATLDDVAMRISLPYRAPYVID